MCSLASLPRSSTLSEGVGNFCNHLYVGWGLPSPKHSNVAGENNVTVLTLSRPMLTIFGGSATSNKKRPDETTLRDLLSYLIMFYKGKRLKPHFHTNVKITLYRFLLVLHQGWEREGGNTSPWRSVVVAHNLI
jgi:hypothetical protein